MLILQNHENKKDEVEDFLKSFQEKKRTFQLTFIDRPKNKQTLLDLELRAIDREKYLDQLEIRAFSEGQLPEDWYGSMEMWVFGKEVYIKICLVPPNSNGICISFHLAEHPMKYPLK